MRYSKELLKGGTPLLVMSVLDGKDLYGYRIIRELEVRSEKCVPNERGDFVSHSPRFGAGGMPKERLAHGGRPPS